MRPAGWYLPAPGAYAAGMNTTELASLHAAGYSTREIARRLNISATTVRRRIRNLPRPEPVSQAEPAAAPAPAEPEPMPASAAVPAPGPVAHDPLPAILAAPEARGPVPDPDLRPRPGAARPPRRTGGRWAPTPPEQHAAAVAACNQQLVDDIDAGIELFQSYGDDTPVEAVTALSQLHRA